MNWRLVLSFAAYLVGLDVVVDADASDVASSSGLDGADVVLPLALYLLLFPPKLALVLAVLASCSEQ